MNFKKYLSCAAVALPMLASAQTTINFETDEAYTALGVYDTWEESPFRTKQLQGNVAVITNELNQEDEILGRAPNASAKMLAVQRSRFGSNTFGARIDLKQTFELTTSTKYVHVFINKPIEGRVMLIGLGKRTERADQSPEAEQFWVLSSSKITPNKWSDAVFAIKGAGGIDIHSLVVVPDCEAPHRLTEDFAAYIDEIEITDSPTPRVIYGDYPINYEATQTSGKSGNYLNNISLNGSADGDQTIEVGSVSPQLIYRSLLNKSFVAKAGETLSPNFSFTSGWMNGYVYLDRGNDGKFSAELNADYTIPEGSDIMTYSYVETVENQEGYKSDGTKITGNARNFINPPAFKLPADLKPGFYRMRFKVDWGSVDPAGRNTSTNDIVSNGGVMADVLINVHQDEISVSRTGGLNGDLLTEDGKELTTIKHAFGKPFTVIAKPASDNFVISHVRVRHGYNLEGDSLVHGNPQYQDVILPSFLFQGNKITIPGTYMDGDVHIEPYFVDPGTGDESGDDYARNFSDDLTNERTDRLLSNISFTGNKNTVAQRITLTTTAPNYVYRDMTKKAVGFQPGETITTSVGYSGRAMHMYLYVDFNQDGKFIADLGSTGIPSMNSELISYTYFNGYNSLGTAITDAPGSVAVNALPVFTLPEMLPVGVYRARLKVDWNNADPAGQWSEGGSNQINENGGAVVDFLLNVHNASHKLIVNSTNGSVNGSGNTGLPPTITPFKLISVVPTPAVSGYKAEQITVKHGHNFDGPQYIRGNRQWSEYSRAVGSFTIPKDSVNGDVIITVDFQPTSEATHALVFGDEFNQADGTQPDADKWRRCERQGATWNRWLSDSEAVVYVKDGHLVTRAIPNPDTSTDNVPMITGGVKTQGLHDFLYGKIEARILTHPHIGNFPAFWMMPSDQSKGWPNDGEIDIWEQIDMQNTAYHTIHSNWTYNLGNKNAPQSSFSESCDMAKWHTYGLEWIDGLLTWYVDGKKVGSYARSTDQNALNKGQWPFDKPFYLILNQSVGNGAWAANADTGHTYETLFDWVRVYQEDPNVGIRGMETRQPISVMPVAGGVLVSAARALPVNICDAAGRLVNRQTVAGNVRIALPAGVYVVNDHKVAVK